MSGWKNAQITTWGRCRQAHMRLARPERGSELPALASARSPAGLIAVGGALSYGDAPLNDNGSGLLTRRLDRIIAFDETTGELVAEAGVTFKDLIAVFLPRGFLPPVIPGTGGVTMGGALANDVHGKNHDMAGSFGDHLLWFDLVMADGVSRRVALESDPELFAASVGGIGLTGIIHRVCFRMQRVASSFVSCRKLCSGNLANLMAALAENRQKATYTVAWLDALATGSAFGRGVLELAKVALADDRPPASYELETKLQIPFDAPGFLLNRLVGRGFNALYFKRASMNKASKDITMADFLFPLDKIGGWNRLYGRRGFLQFQCVIPDAEAERGIAAVMEKMQQNRLPSFLAVLKTLGGEGKGYLSFPLRGYTLALDFPDCSGIIEALASLERVVLDYGGRVYLAKDATLLADNFRIMYPHSERMRRVLQRIAPHGDFNSDMARRLGLVV